MPELLRPIKKKNLKKNGRKLTRYEEAVVKIQYALFRKEGEKLPLTVEVFLTVDEEVKLRRAYEDAGYRVSIVERHYPMSEVTLS